MRVRSKSLASKGKRGAILVELSIVVPLLLFITMGMIDLARWLNVHVRTTVVAYEGIRYIASVAGLKEGESGPHHQETIMRVQRLLQEYGLEEQSIVTAYSGPAPENNNTVTITVQVSHRTYFPWIFAPDQKVVTRVHAPYLYPDEIIASAST